MRFEPWLDKPGRLCIHFSCIFPVAVGIHALVIRLTVLPNKCLSYLISPFIYQPLGPPRELIWQYKHLYLRRINFGVGLKGVFFGHFKKRKKVEKILDQFFFLDEKFFISKKKVEKILDQFFFRRENFFIFLGWPKSLLSNRPSELLRRRSSMQ